MFSDYQSDDDPRAFWRGILLACTLGTLAWLLGAALAAWKVISD